MHHFQNIIYEKRGPGAWIYLNRPNLMNPLNHEIVQEIGEAIEDVEKDLSIKAVVITGKGKAFSAGADLTFIKQIFETPEGAQVFRAYTRTWERVFYNLENCRVPVIAAVNGLALAGGLELVLVCDLVIASEEARIGDQHANFGLIAGGGGTQRLPRKIGINRAKELLITGDWLTPQQAMDWGLVNRVVPANKLEEAATELVNKIAGKSSAASRAVKQLVNQGMQMDIQDALQLEQWAVHYHFTGEDVKEGLAAFKEKRKPVFK
ncbi:MAG: enoyl-CoA hydratase/isomerase family protein [Nitrospinae bacterium]|nr:enoyl-CoA hydratase/isomerase family protein [Nitrospinota bacterium]